MTDTILYNPTPKTICRTCWLGEISYTVAWELQRQLAAKRLSNEIPDTLLLLTHPPTFTAGKSAKPDHLPVPNEVENEGFDFVATDRGGDVTYHGPGQIVGYPILNLQAPPHTPNLHLYLRNLEEVSILTLAEFGLQGGRFPAYTGVWCDQETSTPEKITAIGIRISRWITLHGFALNVCTDLSHYDHIVPCGIREFGVTSLERKLQRPVSLEEVLPVVVRSFEKVFDLACVAIPAEELEIPSVSTFPTAT